MVGVVESSAEEPMEMERSEVPSKAALKETVLLVQHSWPEVVNSDGETNETFFVAYREPGQKSVFFDAKVNKKQPTFESPQLKVEKLPYRALGVHFPQLHGGLSKKFVAPFAEYDELHKGGVTSIEANNGNLMLSTDSTGAMLVWNSSTGELLRSLEGHVLDVNVARFFPSGMVVLSGGMDMSLRIWSVEKGHCARVLTGHTAGIRDVEFIGVGAEVLSAARDGTIRRWNCGTGECVETLNVSRRRQRERAPADRRRVASARRDGRGNALRLGCQIRRRRSPSCRWDRRARVSAPKEISPFVGTNGGKIQVVDLRQRTLVSTLDVNRGRVQRVRALNGGVLASFADGGVCFYPGPLNSAQSSLEMTGADCDPVYDFALADKYLFTACRDRIVRKYTVDSFFSP
ncbi:WD domain, G-beta repeat protein [Aphelenchoides fujianensis]|nr:WD domain, G-beta repeat protein [Aphelenchoides fujianensis]